MSLIKNYLLCTLVSCGAFCLTMLTLFVVLHRKDLCCSQRSDEYWDEAVQHSVQSLISHVSSTYPFMHGAPRTQIPRGVFVVGKPSHYHMCDPLPRLPSYDTVRRTDRQNQGLGLGPNAQPPPSYEESVWLSQDTSTVDVHTLDSATSAENHQTSLNRDNPAALV